MESYQVTQDDYDALGLPGGPGKPEANPFAVPHSPIQVKTGGETLSVGPDGTKRMGTTSINLSDFPGSGQGLLATARTQAGVPTSHPTPDDLIVVEGVPVSLEVAEMMGLVRRNGVGEYHDISGGAQQAPQGPTPEEKAEAEFMENAEPFENVKDEQWLAHINQQMGGAAPALVANVIANGVDGMQGVNDLAYNLGTDPDTLKEVVQDIHALFKAQVDKTVKQSGISDPEAFYEWAWEHAVSDLQNAMNQHVYTRSTKAYQGLIREYARFQQRKG